MKTILKDGTIQYLACDLCGKPLGSTLYSLDIDLCADCMYEHHKDLP